MSKIRNTKLLFTKYRISFFSFYLLDVLERKEKKRKEMSDKHLQPLVSIIIRNRNEAEFLRFVVESINQQRLVETETIVVDNESDDESVAIAQEYNCRVLILPKNSFTYGRALNVGMEAANGEICVLLSAHSMLVGPFALYACVEAFKDPSIAAARFLHFGKRYDVKRWIEPETLADASDIDTIVSKGPLANGCAIRKKVWEEIPFSEVLAAAEEKIWALEVLRKGHRIFSPAPTAYCYLKDLPLNEQIRKNNKELKIIFAETGVKLGHLKEGFAGKAKKFASELLRDPFISVYKTTVRMFLESSLLFSLKKQK